MEHWVRCDPDGHRRSPLGGPTGNQQLPAHLQGKYCYVNRAAGGGRMQLVGVCAAGGGVCSWWGRVQLVVGACAAGGGVCSWLVAMILCALLLLLSDCNSEGAPAHPRLL